jgi:dTDP-4-dehydrorhamnose 3,5-epimerase
MKVTETALPGVLLLAPRQWSDARGMFMETYNHRVMEDLGLPTHWPQDNFSQSRRNVVRGLHYQITQPQGKLVRVLSGAALDIAVDLRRGSPTFGKSVALELRAEDGTMLWIPPGFAHGFAALTEQLSFAYKVTDYYSAAGERTILWNDPALGIEWPVSESDAIVSSKDAAGTRFADAQVFA